MSDRERWTVYPLLFLALGVALRSSGVFGPTKQVLCHRLRIEGTEGKPAIDLLALPQGGVIQVCGANGQPQVVLESSEHGGVLASLSPNRHPLISVGPTPNGGLITVYGPDRTRLHYFGVPGYMIESHRSPGSPSEPISSAGRAECAESNSELPEKPPRTIHSLLNRHHRSAARIAGSQLKRKPPGDAEPQENVDESSP